MTPNRLREVLLRDHAVRKEVTTVRWPVGATTTRAEQRKTSPISRCECKRSIRLSLPMEASEQLAWSAR